MRHEHFNERLILSKFRQLEAVCRQSDLGRKQNVRDAFGRIEIAPCVAGQRAFRPSMSAHVDDERRRRLEFARVDAQRSARRPASSRDRRRSPQRDDTRAAAQIQPFSRAAAAVMRAAAAAFSLRSLSPATLAIERD